MHEGRLGAWHGSAWPVRGEVLSCVSSIHRSSSAGPNRSRGTRLRGKSGPGMLRQAHQCQSWASGMETRGWTPFTSETSTLVVPSQRETAPRTRSTWPPNSLRLR